MHARRSQKTPASSGYKSQKRNRTVKKTNRERGNVRKRKQRKRERKKQKKAATEESRERRTGGKRKKKKERGE
jgi:hypothetical protein